jgi:glycosyltransferase involved in cell wall biosynthesis
VAPEISIILPCRDEARALPGCLAEAAAALRASGLAGEIIVVDNASTDGSADILEASRARYPELVIVREARAGYGLAYRAGIAAARGETVLMADCDGTYRIADLPRFIEAIRAGAALVLGNRFAAPLPPGTMTALRRAGNPALTWLARLLHGVPFRDVHCGIRAARRSALEAMALRAEGMELATEMAIAATRLRLPTAEIPTPYAPRLGASKLRPFRDGWRHVRLILERLTSAGAAATAEAR